MRHRLRTSLLVLLGIAGWLALTPSTAEAQRGRMIARAAVNQYLGRGYGYGGGYEYPRGYGGFSNAYGGGNYGLGNRMNNYGGGYPLYGYSNSGYYGGGYGGGLGNGGYYGGSYGGFGNAMMYGRGGGF